jgi:hypothetical protein
VKSWKCLGRGLCASGYGSQADGYTRLTRDTMAILRCRWVAYRAFPHHGNTSHNPDSYFTIAGGSGLCRSGRRGTIHDEDFMQRRICKWSLCGVVMASTMAIALQGVRRTACGVCTVVRFTFWPFVFAWTERVFEVNQAWRGLDACRLSLALACVSQLACQIHRMSFFIAPTVLFIGSR